MKPSVSIILPTYNGARYISRAITSVQAQTYSAWELIIVDDASTDTTKDIVRSFQETDSRIIYIKNEINTGIQKALNRGIASAKGVYIARIDDDDLWNDAQKLAQQVSFLELHTEYILVGTGAVLIDEKEKELGSYLSPETDSGIRSKILRKNCFVHSSVLFRNSTEKYAEDENVRHIEDYELWLRLGLHGKLANIHCKSVSLSVRTTTLTARNRITQSYKAIALVWRFRKNYPGIISGLWVSCARYVFFLVVSIIPIPSRFLYWIQSQQRGM